MSASLKRTRTGHAQSMRQLKSKMAGLQAHYQQLVQHRQNEIATLLSWIDLTSLEDSTLMGAFLFIQDKATTQDPLMEEWKNAGARFLRRTKTKTSVPSTHPAPSPKTTQQPQKRSESRGE